MTTPHHKSGPDKSKSFAAGTLYIVATPIGNLSDMTFRAVDTLKAADVIACEDTRVSRVLLSHYGITTPTISYRDGNDAVARPAILERLEQGQSVALISDAGTPLISDPGYPLVVEARAKGFRVIPIPGASSVIAALSASGLPTDRFTFLGFLPPKSKARRDYIAKIAAIPITVVMLESPKRLKACLKDLSVGLGPRRAVVAREITKRYEEMREGDLATLAEEYGAQETIRGEIVIVISPPLDAPRTSDNDVDAMLHAALASMTVKEAAAEVAEATGLGRSELYRRALQLKGVITISSPRSWGEGGAD